MIARWIHTTAVLGCAAALLTASAAFAQTPGAPEQPVVPEPHVTLQQKQASDRAIQAGLSQLQAAAAQIQQGAGGQTVADLQAAEADLKSALPIYHGHREESMRATDRAILIVGKNRRNAHERASAEVGKAITEAQIALQTN